MMSRPSTTIHSRAAKSSADQARKNDTDRTRPSMTRSKAGHRPENAIGLEAGRHDAERENRLSHQFSGVIEDYRSDLMTMSDDRLDRSEEDLKKQIDEISAEFRGKLKIIAEYENTIYRSISGEKFEIMPDEVGKKEGKIRQGTTLEERMHYFEAILTTEMLYLEQLRRQWQETQLEIMSLAIETFGSESIQMDGEPIDQKMAAILSAATKTWEDRTAEQTVITERARELEKLVGSLAARAVKVLHDNEKTWRLDAKKKLEKINQIMIDSD